MAPKPKPKLIDNAGKKRLSILLSEAKTRELLYVEAALFSAYSAALQVQGTKIAFLEKKAKPGTEPFEIGEFFVDVVVDLVIGGAAGKLLHAGLERMLRPVLRSRQAYYVAPRFPAGQTSWKDFKVNTPQGVTLSPDMLRRVKKDAARKLRAHFGQVVNSEDFIAYKAVPEALIGSVLEVGSDEARSRVGLSQPKPPAGATSAREEKTIVVQVVTSAQDAYTKQKLAVDKLYAELEATLQYDDITEEQGTAWVEFLQENGKDGVDTEALKKYREYLLVCYELAMWAHSVDLTAVTSETKTHNPRLMSDNRFERYLRDLDEYRITSQDADKVSYRYPTSAPMESGSGYGGVQMAKTVNITRERLDYWINRFPYDMEDPEGPTILQKYESQYQLFERDKTKKEQALRVRAYETLLRKFESIGRELKASYRGLKDASALVK